MHENHCIINGHTAGASGKKLNSYIASGIFSCHEPINFDSSVREITSWYVDNDQRRFNS